MLLERYRERHPAAMLGIGVLYRGSFVGWAPTPIPDSDADATRGVRTFESAYYDESGTRLLPPRSGGGFRGQRAGIIT